MDQTTLLKLFWIERRQEGELLPVPLPPIQVREPTSLKWDIPSKAHTPLQRPLARKPSLQNCNFKAYWTSSFLGSLTQDQFIEIQGLSNTLGNVQEYDLICTGAPGS